MVTAVSKGRKGTVVFVACLATAACYSGGHGAAPAVAAPAAPAAASAATSPTDGVTTSAAASGVPNSSSTAPAAVQASAPAVTLSVVPSPPKWTADSPPSSAVVGRAYSYTFKAAGNPAPTYAVVSGALPTGLALGTTNGVLSGTPSKAARFTFTVRASNGHTPAATSPSLTITVSPQPAGCTMFPADNVWHADISKLPVHARSASWLASMSSSTTHLHPDFGPSYGAQPVPYGIPFINVTNSHPKVSVTFQYASESDAGPYPFGSDTPIEGGQNATGDRHAIMVNTNTCTLYELYDAQYSSSGSTAGSGAIWNLQSDALRPAGWTSADAAGLPILPGLLRPDEVAAGNVTHAIRFTAQHTDRSYVWPARHQAGSRSDPTLPPMGARFRLSATFDMSSYRADTQVVLRAMQKYGLILADNGSNWFFSGSSDTAWDPNLIQDLKRIPASAFAAVDESSLMVNANSGAVKAG